MVVVVGAGGGRVLQTLFLVPLFGCSGHTTTSGKPSNPLSMTSLNIPHNQATGTYMERWGTLLARECVAVAAGHGAQDMADITRVDEEDIEWLGTLGQSSLQGLVLPQEVRQGGEQVQGWREAPERMLPQP